MEKDLPVVRRFVEAEPEKFEAEQDVAIERSYPKQPKRQQLQSWFPPLLIGTGLGIAIAVALWMKEIL